MEQRQVLQVQIDALDQEILNIYRMKALHEAKVEDADKSVNDASTDTDMKRIATESKRTIAYQNRMLEVREAKVKELTVQRDALDASKQ